MSQALCPLTLATLLLFGCGHETPLGKSGPNASAPTRPPPRAPANVPSLNPSTQTTTLAPQSTETNEPSEQGVLPSRKRPGAFAVGRSQLVIDDLTDVAPAGPSVATPAGMLMLLRNGRTVFAPLAVSRSSSKRPQPTPIQPLELDPTELVALEHGPAVTGGHAYFIQGNRLARRKLPSGDIEELAADARAYTRVAVPDLPHPDRPLVVAYIARHPTEKNTLLAKLWVEGQPSLTLTPDGSAGHSVTLARTHDGYVAISLESRTGMSPLHARRVQFEQGKVTLGPDVVPWVAGTAQSLTELHAISDIDDGFTFIPIERDATHFGLARVDVGAFPNLGAAVHWREYPNGLSPAVVTGGQLCGKPVVFYARPATAEPHAPQELHLALIGAAGLGPSTVVAASRAFADASFAGLDDGALVVYVADRRTWARRLRCVPL